MRSYHEFLQDHEIQLLMEGEAVDYLGKAYLSLLGAALGGVKGIAKGAMNTVGNFAKGMVGGAVSGWQEDPLQIYGPKKAENFKKTMAEFQAMLKKVSPEQAQTIKQQVCQAIQAM